jgi:hypothetical protein
MAISQNYPDVVGLIYDYLTSVIYPDIQGEHVFYGNQNNIVLPDDNDYCIFYVSGINRTATTIEKYDPQNERMQYFGKGDMTCRVDLYASSQNGDTNITALQRAENLALLFKSDYTAQIFKDTALTPLFADEPSDTSLPSSDSGNYLFRSSVTLHFYVNHDLTIDTEGFNQPPQIHLNSIVQKPDAVGNELHISNLDVKLKERI